VARLLRMRTKASPSLAKPAKPRAARKHPTAPTARARKRAPAPKTGARSFWNGYLQFGLVQIPVGLHSGETRNEIDFDLLDRRDQAPIGYLKVNKETGEEVPAEEIVRGIKLASGRYVVVTDEEIARAAGEASRTIEVVEFVDRDAIAPVYFERPLHLSPAKAGEKVYALLARALAESAKIGIAKVILRARESLAALVPLEGRLVLNLLRWEHELRPAPPAPAASARPRAGRELVMARRLIEEMSGEFRPASFTDRYRKELLALVRRRARTGSPPELLSPRRRPARAANVVDLVALLEKSVKARKGAGRTPTRRKRSA
jgi:DNA end-binding protein Ku